MRQLRSGSLLFWCRERTAFRLPQARTTRFPPSKRENAIAGKKKQDYFKYGPVVQELFANLKQRSSITLRQ